MSAGYWRRCAGICQFVALSRVSQLAIRICLFQTRSEVLGSQLAVGAPFLAKNARNEAPGNEIEVKIKSDRHECPSYMKT
jgi:hypothetical protein